LLLVIGCGALFFFFYRQTVSGFIYRVMLVKIYAYALSLNGSPLKNDLFSLVCPVAPTHLAIGLREAGQLSECSYAKTPIATNDMNFLVFNIKVCMIYVGSLN